MSVANITRSQVGAQLPPELRMAQDAMNLPDVQDMLKKLSAYNLGIYMPHMHDDASGAFQPLPAGMSQVEDGLQVSFREDDEIAPQPDVSFLPVGWFWRDGASAQMVCTARCVMMGTQHTSGHTKS